MGYSTKKADIEVPNMNTEKDQNICSTDVGTEKAAKSPYEPPRIVARQDLETVASACPTGGAHPGKGGGVLCTYANS